MLSRAEMMDVADEPGAPLTARERQIALLAARGLRNKAIARELQLCEGTVKVHIHNILQKLGINSRMVLAAQPHLLRRPPLLREVTGSVAPIPLQGSLSQKSSAEQPRPVREA